MAPSFTKGGKCNGHGVNFAFTWGLVGFLTFLSALISFTDSVTDKHGDTYYGLATCDGFLLFDKDKEQEYSSPSSPDDGSDVMSRKIWWEDIKRKKKLRPQDYVNALIRAAVFMALAFCDAGVQDCLVPKESRQWRDFLAILPLAVGFLASFVFIIFPSNRKGIGAEGDSVVDLDAAKSHGINPKDKSEKP
ncbi:hypothetical protein BS78_05G064200 [Paspalum vaginatum]|nr:hypothetical protein BS78_05G064200 [Paspalum vaginatum]